jgi:hypothetical protein
MRSAHFLAYLSDLSRSLSAARLAVRRSSKVFQMPALSLHIAATGDYHAGVDKHLTAPHQDHQASSQQRPKTKFFRCPLAGRMARLPGLNFAFAEALANGRDHDRPMRLRPGARQMPLSLHPSAGSNVVSHRRGAPGARCGSWITPSIEVISDERSADLAARCRA